MAEEQVHLIHAQEQANQYLHHVDEAMASAETEEMRRHVQEGIQFGQAALDHLEEAVSLAEDPDMADRIDEAMHHLGLSIDQGDQALEASDEEVEDFVSEMRKHAQDSMAYLGQALGTAP